jgi:glutamine cyclotransferase
MPNRSKTLTDATEKESITVYKAIVTKFRKIYFSLVTKAVNQPMKYCFSFFFSLVILYVTLNRHVTTSYKVGQVVKDVLKVSRHDDKCFTQGLVIDGDILYESCGLYGKSSLRKIDIKNGFQILKSKPIPAWIFAEGLTMIGKYLFMLTWKERIVLVYEAETLKLIDKYSIETKNNEGWGASTDGKHLIVSDGTEYITFYQIPSLPAVEDVSSLPVIKYDQHNLPQKSLAKVKEIRVYDTLSTRSVNQINELEYVNGFIFANIWYQDIVLQINPENGHIVERYDLSKIFPRKTRNSHADCLNGIAYNEKEKSFLITGKFWSKYFHINFTKAFEYREYF